MPGFQINGTGARDDAGPVGNYEAKRRYRWVFSIDTAVGGGSFSDTFLYLKEAKRPSWSTEPIEQHHNQEKIRHIGKTSWEDIALKWYDMEQPDCSKIIYEWMQVETYNIQSATPRKPGTYKKTSTLLLLDNAGEEIEEWRMYNSWPFKVDGDNVDYEANNLLMFTCTLAYDRAQMVSANAGV